MSCLQKNEKKERKKERKDALSKKKGDLKILDMSISKKETL